MVTEAYDYDAYGNALGFAPSTATTNLLYTGEWRDEHTGTYNLRARDYDPTTGRFLTIDTFPGSTQDPISLHKYLYCHNSPIMNIDPSGMSIIEPGGGGGYPYTIRRGLMVHAIFYVLASVQGGFYNTPVGQLLKSLNKGITPIGYALLRPDAVIGKGPKRGFYELKPINHWKRRGLATATAAQMRYYDIAFSQSGIRRGKSNMFLGGVPFEIPIPGGFIYDGGSWWSVKFFAAKKDTPVFGDGRGLIYYSLKKTNRRIRSPRVLPRLVRQLERVPDWARENIRLPLLPALATGEAGLAMQQGIKTGTTYAVTGVSAMITFKILQSRLAPAF